VEERRPARWRWNRDLQATTRSSQPQCRAS
jgi:hypothetical protein